MFQYLFQKQNTQVTEKLIITPKQIRHRRTINIK